MSEMEFALPDVGEGLTEAEIVSWQVAPGDNIALNQVICEIETAKSVVELPSPFEGVVTEVLAQPGETVPVGSAIMRVRTESPAGAETAAPDPAPVAPTAATTSASAPAAPIAVAPSDEDDKTSGTVAEATVSDEAASDEESGSVLVGYGTGGTVKSRRRRGGEPLLDSPILPITEASPVLAKPPIRKLAKDLGVDLTTLVGSGIGGEILRDDVVRQASQASVFRNIVTPEASEDREERIPVKGMRKQIAKAMSKSAFSAPHVSVFVEIDATRTMEFVKRLKASTDFVGVKVSPLLIMAKAVIWAVRRNPMVNSTWTDEEIIVHNFVNLGLAAATPRGLIVPNIKDAQNMSLLDLAKSIEQMTITARDGRTQPAEMANGTITITNIGVFGMDSGVPILNPGEVAIVAMGAIKQKPWVVDGEVRPRYVTTVSGSFDHRVVDGDVVSRFTADIASVLEEPALLLD